MAEDNENQKLVPVASDSVLPPMVATSNTSMSMLSSSTQSYKPRSGRRTETYLPAR